MTICFGAFLLFSASDISWAQQKVNYIFSDYTSASSTPHNSPKHIFVQNIDVIGNTVLSKNELDDIIKLYEGRQLTLKDLKKLRSQISQLYIDRGFITSGAFLPPQDVTDGVVKIQTIEGTLPTIKIEGTQKINPEYVRYRVELGVTRPLNVDKLKEQLRLLGSELLFKNVESDLQAGSNLGESILTINITEVDYAELSTLIEQFKNGDNVEKRLEAIEALVKTGTPDSIAVALGELSAEVESAVPKLRTDLKNADVDVRSSAALILGKVGAAARSTIPDIAHNLKECELSERKYFISSIESIAISINTKANTLSIFELNQVISDLEATLNILQSLQNKFSPNEIAQINFPLELLKFKRNKRIFTNKILDNHWLWGATIYFILILGLFWIRPLWLLKSYNLIKPIRFKFPVLDFEISLGFLLFPKYHTRVLDAWVATNINSAQENFLTRDTVQDRQVFIPAPVVLDGINISQFSSTFLRSKLDRKRCCILIWGEGGIGKTSLAVQIALWSMTGNTVERPCRHKMLPILIEIELRSESETDANPLMRLIQGQLQDLTNQTGPISDELLDQLLRKKRIIVIVDHYSEWSEASRKLIRPELPDFPINALVITSRLEERLGKVTKNIIKPLRIEGNRLSSFMEAYLTQLGKREQFSDIEFFEACSRLSKMMGTKNVTVLLAKLYIEKLIGVKNSLQAGQLPNNIPELMLSYLNELNRNVETDRLSDRIIHQDVKAIAWGCLKQTYQPIAIFRKTAISLMGGNDAEFRLKYIEERLRLIQSNSPAKDKIRFTLDPLAEYLASLHLIDIYKDNERLWLEFLAQITTSSEALISIQGFLLAVRECCSIKNKEVKVPHFVLEELDNRALSGNVTSIHKEKGTG